METDSLHAISSGSGGPRRAARRLRPTRACPTADSALQPATSVIPPRLAPRSPRRISSCASASASSRRPILPQLRRIGSVQP
eukprot:scaffold4129_cov390-Prasinococcus_capsulatus_cf.AAC.3